MENNILLRFRNAARISSYAVIIVCILVFTGWQFDIESLKRPIPGMISMNPVTTLGCMLCAAGALLLNHGSKKRVLLRIFSAVVVLTGILRLLPLAGGADSGIDLWLYHTRIQADAATGESYHMAPSTAFNFVLLGISLLLSASHNTRTIRLGNYLAILSLLISLLVVLGYSYVVPEFHSVLSFFPMAVHTATCFALLSIAILFSSCNARIITILFSTHLGGRAARYMLPFILLVPVMLGYARIWLSRKLPVSTELGVALLITCIIIVFYIITWYLSEKLDNTDLHKAEAEQQLAAYNRELEIKNTELERSRELHNKIIGETEEYAIIVLDAGGCIEHWNKGAANINGYMQDEITGKHFGIFYTREDRDKGLPGMHLKIATEEGKAENEGWRIRKDGSLFWAITTITPLFDNANRLFGFCEFSRDLTHTKRLEEQLRELNSSLEKKVEQRTRELSDYKYALDESSIVAITDQKGVIQYVNDNFCTISKYSREELIGKDHRIINSGHHPGSFIRELWVTIANGQIWRGELKNKARDGSYYWVDTTIVPFLDKDGKPYQYVAIRFDITTKKEGELIRQKLQDKVDAVTRELAGVFEKISDGFIMLDNEFRYTYVNHKTGEMVNRVPASLIGKCVWDEFPDAVNSGTYLAFRQAMEEQQYICNIDYYQPLDLWQENHIYPSPTGLSVFIRDISDQKRAQEKIARSERIYKTIASGIPGSVICLFDQEYRYLLVEGDMLEKFGYSKERLSGQKAEDVLTHERFEDLLPDLQRVFSGEVFSRHINRNGYDIMVRYVPLVDENGGIYAAMSVGIDITELQHAYRSISDLNLNLEKKVNERTEQLQVLNKELESFSYSVSHDLRAPLRAVNGYATMLEEDYAGVFDDEGMRLLKVIQRNATRMGTLIDDLLSFSRLGRKELNKTMVNMNEVVKSVLAEIRQAGTYNIRVETGDLHQALADHTLIYQVFTNLISNALKYSSKNPDALVQVFSEEQEDCYVYTVQDNGVGFDTRYMHKLFGVFQRLHPPDEFEGTGVGLAIVEKLVSKHGGTIRAASEIGKGAAFSFSLPKHELNI
jgi:PAS domain S-box-containing protein